LGGNCARGFKQPTRNEELGGFSVSAGAQTGVPELVQNELLRFAPLSAVLTYTFGCPVSNRNVAAGAGTDTRNAEPVSI